MARWLPRPFTRPPWVLLRDLEGPPRRGANRLSAEEACGFWREVAVVPSAVERRYKPMKMNWLSVGNGVPHLHVHLVPRYGDDPHASGPLEQDAFDHDRRDAFDDATLHCEA